MKLSTVIEILDLNTTAGAKRMPTDTLLALRIAIEAVKRLIANRTGTQSITWAPLPGETTE